MGGGVGGRQLSANSGGSRRRWWQVQLATGNPGWQPQRPAWSSACTHPPPPMQPPGRPPPMQPPGRLAHGRGVAASECGCWRAGRLAAQCRCGPDLAGQGLCAHADRDILVLCQCLRLGGPRTNTTSGLTLPAWSARPIPSMTATAGRWLVAAQHPRSTREAWCVTELAGRRPPEHRMSRGERALPHGLEPARPVFASAPGLR
jgi:hypothetical protein